MVAMRLTRKGMNKRPHYRIVVAEKSFARDGKFIENLGTFDPLAKANGVTLKPERIHYWLKQGAQPSLTVKQILKKHLKPTRG